MTNSCWFSSFSFCHASLRSPGSYNESLRFATTPSSPRPRTADVARSARAGRARAAAMATPMARRRASPGRRDATSEGARRVLANACSTGNRRQVVGPLNRGFVACHVASAIEAGPSKGVSRGPGMHQISGSILIRRLGSGWPLRIS